jgi:hypothetical protein
MRVTGMEFNWGEEGTSGGMKTLRHKALLKKQKEEICTEVYKLQKARYEMDHN